VLTVGSLFSGVGGFDLGFERAGMRTLWFAEQNDYCRRVLARHWPGVPCHPDVRALGADTSGARRRQDVRGAHGDEGADARRGSQDADQPDGRDEGGGAGPVLPVPVPYVDVLCGGFPCQDLSYAGKGAGIDGERSGLWSEYARLIRELRPRYVVVENVPALLGRGLGRVLGDLAACGYDAEWDCLPASAFGAPHRRDRVWVVAPTPTGGEAEVIRDQNGIRRRGEHAGMSLTDYVRPDRAKTKQQWPTPHGMPKPGQHRRPGPSGNELGRAVNQAERQWPTPKAQPSGPDYARTNREGSDAADLATAVARGTPGQLNPTWVEWLMGFPLGWTDLQPSGTLSCQLSPNGSANESSNTKRDG
jgi:DNA-cytosine methyltransferase